ncbi:MAG: hypothetical protein ACM31L_08490 [Actinomycetota bacterium]
MLMQLDDAILRGRLANRDGVPSRESKLLLGKVLGPYLPYFTDADWARDADGLLRLSQVTVQIGRTTVTATNNDFPPVRFAPLWPPIWPAWMERT